jgi:succinoglycan biosynthesis protein ExoO
MSASNSPAADSHAQIDVSFAIACYNALPYLDQAIGSALAQKDVGVEVLVVDDGSSDGSRERAAELAAADPRIRLLTTPVNSGPGGARNLAIDAMRGRWLAVLDSDDLILSERTRTLIDAAEAAGADLVADDLVIFGDGLPDETFLAKDWASGGGWMTLDRYLRDSALFGRAPNPGFLKPMFRREIFAGGRNRYNPDLRIAEDDELIVRLLLADHRYLVLPTALYHYRKHAASISHRLSPANAERMVRAERELREAMAAAGPLPPAYRRRWHALLDARAFVGSLDLFKRRAFAAALLTLLRRPGAMRLYSMPIAARLGRLRARLVGKRGPGWDSP